MESKTDQLIIDNYTNLYEDMRHNKINFYVLKFCVVFEDVNVF